MIAYLILTTDYPHEVEVGVGVEVVQYPHPVIHHLRPPTPVPYPQYPQTRHFAVHTRALGLVLSHVHNVAHALGLARGLDLEDGMKPIHGLIRNTKPTFVVKRKHTGTEWRFAVEWSQSENSHNAKNQYDHGGNKLNYYLLRHLRLSEWTKIQRIMWLKRRH